ncbi:unnamed protein product, partial [Ixodes pacificus]
VHRDGGQAARRGGDPQRGQHHGPGPHGPAVPHRGDSAQPDGEPAEAGRGGPAGPERDPAHLCGQPGPVRHPRAGAEAGPGRQGAQGQHHC